jgi:DNA invertase Pin-like site-specific DNA recombinase
MFMSELSGYARTSTKEQKLDLQLDALRGAGVEDRHLYTDQASGARKDRPGFLACWAYLQPGDTLTVWRLDRLARSLRHLIELAEELRARAVALRILEGPFAHMDTTTSEGKLMFSMLGAFAEFERALIRDRVVAGLTAARARGRKGGRRPKLSPEQQRHAVMMAESKIPITEIAKTLQCSRHTVYKALEQTGVTV